MVTKLWVFFNIYFHHFCISLVFFALLKLVKKEKIDIISSHWIVPNGFITSIVSLVSGVAFTTTIPGSDVYMGGRNFFFRAMVGFAAWRAGYVLSDSDHYLKQLNDLGFFPKKTRVIRYGVNMKKFKLGVRDKGILKKLNISDSALIILAVGRMVSKKGFKYLVDAMPMVLSKMPKTKLVMVGDGEKKESLEKRVDELKIKNNVIFAGTISHDELSKYYSLADVFVMPSIKDEEGNLDASPVAMLEAMACGARVVATKFSGTIELVIEGETGSLVREKDSREIANSIISLLTRRQVNIRTKVRKIARENFSVEVVAKKYIDVFEDVLM